MIQVAAVAGAVAFSVMVLSSPSGPTLLPLPQPDVGGTDSRQQQQPRTATGSSVSILATNLEQPRAIALHGDRVFVTEKGGTIRVIENGTLLEQPLAVLRAADVFDGGLLGIDVHPEFAENHYMYVFLTEVVEDDDEGGTGAAAAAAGEDAAPPLGGGSGDGGGALGIPAAALQNRILRITESGNRLQDAVTILEGIPGSKFSNGGFVKFGPDGRLYVGTGTPSESSHLPQDQDSLAGKILRINDDGSIPGDNPFPGSPVYSIGHRNPQGMTWDDEGRLYVAEHGPEKNDEINIIVPGADYGWPSAECAGGGGGGDGPEGGEGGREQRPAVLCYDPSIEPGGIAFYDGERLGLDHPFVMASLRASNLYQLDFEEGLPSQQSILSGVGRIRDVAVHPDGSIYIITSNTDGKGFPEGDDDRLVRIQR